MSTEVWCPGSAVAKAESLTRPVSRLLDLSLLERDLPFGTTARETKRTYYRLADPFLGFWYRFVEPNRSRLAKGQLSLVSKEVQEAWPQYFGKVWEQIARDSVARIEVANQRWLPAGRWWGKGTDGQALELDIVSSHPKNKKLCLVGEVKTTCSAKESQSLLEQLKSKAARCPILQDKELVFVLFVLNRKGHFAYPHIIGANEVCS